MYSTPRSGKFNEIKALSGRKKGRAGASPAPSTGSSSSTQVRAATQRVAAQAAENDVDDDADAKLERRRYAELVTHMSAQASRYHSIGVFVEAMLRELLARDDVSAASRAAAATWGLNLLAGQSSGGAVEAAVECLMPAVYCHYDPSRLDLASPAVQLQVTDKEVVRGNPIFTHSMFVEQVHVDHERAATLQDALARAASANDGRRDYVVRVVNGQRRRQLEAAFRGWRAHVRRVRLLRMTNDRRGQRTEAELARLRLRGAFYEWKTLLELSRVSFLTERLHDSAVQLENAKNQFQLQCYRADKLIQTTKQAKEELEEALAINDALRGRVAELEELLVQREKEYNEKLARNVSESFRVVRRYQALVAALVETQPPPESYIYENPDADIEPMLRKALEGAGASPPASPRAGEEGQGQQQQQQPAAPRTLDVPAVDAVLRWCNSVLHEVDGAESQRVRTFGVDFASGEHYLTILSYVFPEVVPPASRQALNTESRLRRIRLLGDACALRYPLEPIDFVNEREDRIYLSVSEIYLRHLLLRQRRASTQLEARADAMLAELARAAEAGPETPLASIDEASFQDYIKTCDDDILGRSERLLATCRYESELMRDSVDVTKHVVFLDRERAKGLPIVAASVLAAERFWQFSFKPLADLKQAASTVEAAAWRSVLAEQLPAVLREAADTTSRLFYHFAGDGANTMAEMQFWHFVDGAKGVLVGKLERDGAAAAFDRVASPQLEAALRQAAHGKTAAEAEALAVAARQELDVRQLSASQFVETLIRMSVSAGVGRGFVDGVRAFLAGIQLPYPDRTTPAAVAAFYERESRQVLKFFREDLVRVFFFYVRQQEGSRSVRDRALATQQGGRFCSLMAVATYLAILDDCEMLRESSYTDAERALHNVNPRTPYCVPADRVRAAVATLQQAYPHVPEEAMNYQMFLESFAVVCHYWCPDALVPQSRKLAAFLADLLRQLSQRHSKSTLILSAAPDISLEGGKQVDFL